MPTSLSRSSIAGAALVLTCTGLLAGCGDDDYRKPYIGGDAKIGKQLIMTRGALTTFSIGNDVAKYFAILPAMFATVYATGATAGPLSVLNVMGLSSPQSAILSAVIFNALIIVALIPVALRGVAYRAIGADALLRRNLLVYGLGGVAAPFIGIKLIDLALAGLHLV